MKPNKQTFTIALISALICACSFAPQNGNAGPKAEAKAVYTLYNCLLDSIGASDTLHILYETHGCFHGYTETIRMFRHADTLYAELSNSEAGTRGFKPTHKVEPLKKVLSDSSILAFALFEQEGRTLKTSDGCTTREAYEIRIKSIRIAFEDNGCDYEGFTVLKYKLFGKTDYEGYYRKVLGE